MVRIMAPGPVQVMRDTVALRFMGHFDEHNVQFVNRGKYETHVRVWTGRQIVDLQVDSSQSSVSINIQINAGKKIAAFLTRCNGFIIPVLIPGPTPSVDTRTAEFSVAYNPEAAGAGVLLIYRTFESQMSDLLELIDQLVADERQYWDQKGVASVPNTTW
jgi:hypothetical protein